MEMVVLAGGQGRFDPGVVVAKGLDRVLVKPVELVELERRIAAFVREKAA